MTRVHLFTLNSVLSHRAPDSEEKERGRRISYFSLCAVSIPVWRGVHFGAPVHRCADAAFAVPSGDVVMRCPNSVTSHTVLAQGIEWQCRSPQMGPGQVRRIHAIQKGSWCFIVVWTRFMFPRFGKITLFI